MRSVNKTVYYCEFCKKHGLHAGVIRKHEARCTANPQRKCGVCGMLGGEQAPMEELLRLARAIPRTNYAETGIVPPGRTVAIQALYDAADNCPACILAALRQIDSDVPYEFKREMERVWDEIHEKEQVYYGCT